MATGQTTIYAIGDDGDLQKGVSASLPRFTDNGDGTVTDKLTGLVWLKNANCYGKRTWVPAVSLSNSLADGKCGLTDGSSAGDWRLPNVKELLSLVDYGVYYPALPNTAGTGKWSENDPFINVQWQQEYEDYYWSSTVHPFGGTTGWQKAVAVNFRKPSVRDGMLKTTKCSVWPLRGGK
jgi:hypothetical protein